MELAIESVKAEPDQPQQVGSCICCVQGQLSSPASLRVLKPEHLAKAGLG